MANLTFSNIVKPPAVSANPFSIPTKQTANPFASALSNVASGVKASPTPSTPLKSTTVNNMDGSSTVHEYHAPAKNDVQVSGVTEQQVKDNLANYQANNKSASSTSSPVPAVNNNPSGYSEYAIQNPQPKQDIGTQLQNSGTSYGGLLGQGTQYLTQAGDVGKEAGLLRQAISRETQDVMHNPYYSGSVRIGQSGQIQQNQGAQLQALTDQQKALAEQGQGFISAAGAAAPVQVPYSNQYIDPITGKPIGGGSVGQLPQQAQDIVNTYAQQVKEGKMTRQDAESRLSAYGVVGTNALTQALGQGFNTNASNASAGTTATGQQVKTSADSTNRALDTLSTAFNSLPGWQTGGIPVTNSIANWIGQQFGQEALSAYKTNLADARSQLIGVLNSSGGTPTGNEATANQYLPDNMTKAQFDTNVGTPDKPGIVRQLIDQKVQAFTQSGQQSNAGSGSVVSAGGYNFKQDANGNWVPA